MDKILSRKLFRQKYLDLVGVKNLPKFAVGGNMGNVDMSDYKQGNQGIMAALNPSQDQLAAMNTKLEEASTPKKTTSNETFMGFGGEGSAVSADQARLNILLPIAAQLMAGTVRPGQSSISGLIESAGKGLSTVGTNILAMKQMDLKKRKEDREAAASSGLMYKQPKYVYDVEKGINRFVPFAEIVNNAERYPTGKIEKETLYFDKPWKDKSTGRQYGKAELGTFTSRQLYDLMYGPNKDSSFVDSTIKPSAMSIQDQLNFDRITKVNADKIKTESKQYTSTRGRSIATSELLSGLDQYVELIRDPEVKLGSVGSVVRVIDNLRALVNNISGFSEGSSEYRQQQLKDGNEKERINEVFGSSASLSTLKDRDGVSVEEALNGENSTPQQRDAWAYLTSMASKGAGVSAVFTEMLYAIAKAREEGGRFSVSDIELAARALGGTGSSKEQAYAAVKAIKENFLIRTYKNADLNLGVLDEANYTQEELSGKVAFADLTEAAKRVRMENAFIKKNYWFKDVAIGHRAILEAAAEKKIALENQKVEDASREKNNLKSIDDLIGTNKNNK